MGVGIFLGVWGPISGLRSCQKTEPHFLGWGGRGGPRGQDEDTEVQSTGTAPRPAALTGISRARWSAGECQLSGPPLAAARGTEAQPGPPGAAACGPPPPGWTPGPRARPAPTWHFEPAGEGGAGRRAVPQLSSSAGSCGGVGPPRVGGRGGLGWWAARSEAGCQGEAGGQASGQPGSRPGHLTPASLPASRWKDPTQPAPQMGRLRPETTPGSRAATPRAPALPPQVGCPGPFPAPILGPRAPPGQAAPLWRGGLAHQHSGGGGGDGRHGLAQPHTWAARGAPGEAPAARFFILGPHLGKIRPSLPPGTGPAPGTSSSCPMGSPEHRNHCTRPAAPPAGMASQMRGAVRPPPHLQGAVGSPPLSD